MTGSAADRVRVIGPGQTYVGKQGFTYGTGASAETVGAQQVCMNILPIPVGGRAKVHYHRGIETIAYQMRLEPNTYTLVGDPLLSNDTFGIAFKKDNTALRDAVAGAFDAVIKDGTYDEILKKWGLVHNAVPKAVVNGVK